MSFAKKSRERTSKAFISNGNLPSYVDPSQPPSRKEPFSTILNQPFTHSVELLLPEKLCNSIWQDVSARITDLKYSRVFMSLSELVDGDFFNKYIKAGNIMMISEGRPGIDDKYILKDGTLRLELAKETYERSGLLGKPMRDMGRLHLKTRYSVEIDLRPLSMLHGKKGFERIVWAFKNVLNRSVTWLFHDFEKYQEEASRPIAQHHPFNHTVTAQRSDMQSVLTPPLDIADASKTDADLEDWALDTYEWLGLVSIQSPRVQASDKIDSYLSRYQVPSGEDDSATQCNMIKMSWKGFIPISWIRDLFIVLNDRCSRTDSAVSPKFFALSAHALKTEVQEQLDGYTILWLANHQGQHTQSTEGQVNPEKKIQHSEKRGSDFVVFKLCQNSLY